MLTQDRTDGDLSPALEYMFAKGSPQILSHAFTPIVVLPLNLRLASSGDTQTQPRGAAEATSSWPSSF